MQLNLFNTGSPTIVRQDEKEIQKIYQYFLLLSPQEQVKEKVVLLKKKLDDRMRISADNLHSKPHISLMLIPAAEKIDELIRSRVCFALVGKCQFNVSLNKADFFEHAYTKDLILKVESPENIQHVFSLLHNEFSLFKRQVSFVPHVTIARGIPKNDLNKVILNLDEFDCKVNFTCNNVTILRRTAQHDGKRFIPLSHYKKIEEVRLGQ